ncbi:MAG: terminase gpA endonuclease subunit [Rhodospirillaceae bacterium]
MTIAQRGADFPAPLPIVAGALARVFAPPEPLVPSRWMAEHLIVPDGPRAGGRWDPSLTPYVGPIVDCLGPDSPHNLVAVRKSAQTGVSVAAIGLVAAYIDRAPCRIGYALPTIDALQEFNREKLTPTIEHTEALKARIRPQTSRSATGSTTTSKQYPGGSLVLINANSAPDLRAKTLKVGIGDEVDEWAADLEGQGDPWGLFMDRFIAFHATGDYRLLALSTPRLLAESRIDDLFQRGDRRYWHITCPHCDSEIPLEFGHLTFNKRPPYQAHYITQCCGCEIRHYEKATLVRAGRFIATHADGLYPSFHVDALISQLTTWDKIAEEAVAAEGDERKTKKFTNTTLGLPYEVKGDAPDHVRLMERREEYAENRVPPLALLLTAGADVQHKGIWVEIVAFSPDRQSWTVSVRWLEGDTTDPNKGAWLALQELYDERFEDAFGNTRLIDAIAVDAGDGARANQAYAWARGRHRAYAIKGMSGWGRPALGTPTKVQVSLHGKRITGGAMVWPVGTFDLKAEFYANVRKDGRKAGQELDPPGYCHFGSFLNEAYFLQITSEHLADVRAKGRLTKVWQQISGRPNHLLDARVYATAMAEHLGLTRKTRDQWAALAQRYGLPLGAGDLFSPAPLAVEREQPPDAAAVAKAEAAAALKATLADKPAGAASRPGRFARLKRVPKRRG